MFVQVQSLSRTCSVSAQT